MTIKKTPKIEFSKFFKLSSGEQKKAIKKAVLGSNKKQIDLIKRYNEKYPGKASFIPCTNF